MKFFSSSHPSRWTDEPEQAEQDSWWHGALLMTGVWMIWKVSGWYDKRLHDLINVQIIWKCSANLWLKILQLSNRAAQKQTCWKKLRELINTPHLAGELEWGQMARKLTPSTRQTPLSRNQQGKPHCKEIHRASLKFYSSSHLSLKRNLRSQWTDEPEQAVQDSWWHGALLIFRGS